MSDLVPVQSVGKDKKRQDWAEKVKKKAPDEQVSHDLWIGLQDARFGTHWNCLAKGKNRSDPDRAEKMKKNAHVVQ